MYELEVAVLQLGRYNPGPTTHILFGPIMNAVDPCVAEWTNHCYGLVSLTSCANWFDRLVFVVSSFRAGRRHDDLYSRDPFAERLERGNTTW